MSKRQARMRKQADIAAAKEIREKERKDNDIWYARQDARNNNTKAVVTQKLIGHLGQDCVDAQNHQILYDSKGFYYDVVDESMIRIVGLNSKEQPFNINSGYFQRNLHNFLDRHIASA